MICSKPYYSFKLTDQDDKFNLSLNYQVKKGYFWKLTQLVILFKDQIKHLYSRLGKSSVSLPLFNARWAWICKGQALKTENYAFDKSNAQKMITSQKIVNLKPFYEEEQLTSIKQHLLINPDKPLLWKGFNNSSHTLFSVDSEVYQNSVITSRQATRVNHQTLIQFSDGSYYPANCFHLSSLLPTVSTIQPAYTISSSPKNNEVYCDTTKLGNYNSQQAFYQMLIDQESPLHVAVAKLTEYGGEIDKTKFNYLSAGESLTVINKGKSYKITCAKEEKIACEGLESSNFNESALFIKRQLEISTEGQPNKIIYQFLATQAILPTFDAHLKVIELIEDFIKQQKLVVNLTHPLTVTCEAGLDRSGRFIVLHALEKQLETALIPYLSTNMTEEEITNQLLDGVVIHKTLIELAKLVESLTVLTASIQGIEGLLPNFVTYSGEKIEEERKNLKKQLYIENHPAHKNPTNEEIENYFQEIKKNKKSYAAYEQAIEKLITELKVMDEKAIMAHYRLHVLAKVKKMRTLVN